MRQTGLGWARDGRRTGDSEGEGESIGDVIGGRGQRKLVPSCTQEAGERGKDRGGIGGWGKGMFKGEETQACAHARQRCS